MWVWRITAAGCFGELWRACQRERHQKERGTESTRESDKGEVREEREETWKETNTEERERKKLIKNYSIVLQCGLIFETAL